MAITSFEIVQVPFAEAYPPSVQIRTEFFNAFNHPNFETPQDVIDGPNFGRVTGADRPREIQIGIKLIF